MNFYDSAKRQSTFTTPEGEYFKSYDSIIALIDIDRVVHLSPHWDYSATTGKYRNKFLGEGIKETRKKIKSGEYKMDIIA